MKEPSPTHLPPAVLSQSRACNLKSIPSTICSVEIVSASNCGNRFSDCCWINELGATDLKYSIQTSGSLNVRQDTGKVNSSPVSATSPIVRLQWNCSYSLDIVTDDPDGDEVRCRWAKGIGECGGVCRSLPGATLEPVCSLRYSKTITDNDEPLT